MADVINSKAVFSPELLHTLEFFQQGDNEYIGLYVSHLNKLTDLLFECVDNTTVTLSKDAILEYLQLNHMLARYLNTLKAN